MNDGLWTLKSKGEGVHPVVHVCPELGPLCQPLDGVLLLGQSAGGLLQLLLVPLQVAHALRLQQVELLTAALVQGDVLVHVGVEAVVAVGWEKGV